MSYFLFHLFSFVSYKIGEQESGISPAQVGMAGTSARRRYWEKGVGG
jgi:hypothetical protein